MSSDEQAGKMNEVLHRGDRSEAETRHAAEGLTRLEDPGRYGEVPANDKFGQRGAQRVGQHALPWRFVADALERRRMAGVQAPALIPVVSAAAGLHASEGPPGFELRPDRTAAAVVVRCGSRPDRLNE